jgi:hypothetical protein
MDRLMLFAMLAACGPKTVAPTEVREGPSAKVALMLTPPPSGSDVVAITLENRGAEPVTLLHPTWVHRADCPAWATHLTLVDMSGAALPRQPTCGSGTIPGHENFHVVLPGEQISGEVLLRWILTLPDAGRFRLSATYSTDRVIEMGLAPTDVPSVAVEAAPVAFERHQAQ